MSVIELLSVACLLAGTAFFVAGSIALLRFPDVYSRLHALAKVDNLGLGFIVLGMLLTVDGIALGVKLLLVWLLVLMASAAVSFLIARRARMRGMRHWRVGEDRR